MTLRAHTVRWAVDGGCGKHRPPGRLSLQARPLSQQRHTAQGASHSYCPNTTCAGGTPAATTRSNHQLPNRPPPLPSCLGLRGFSALLVVPVGHSKSQPTSAWLACTSFSARTTGPGASGDHTYTAALVGNNWGGPVLAPACQAACTPRYAGRRWGRRKGQPRRPTADARTACSNSMQQQTWRG
jgi:hypothetical protein